MGGEGKGVWEVQVWTNPKCCGSPYSTGCPHTINHDIVFNCVCIQERPGNNLHKDHMWVTEFLVCWEIDTYEREDLE